MLNSRDKRPPWAGADCLAWESALSTSYSYLVSVMSWWPWVLPTQSTWVVQNTVKIPTELGSSWCPPAWQYAASLLHVAPGHPRWEAVWDRWELSAYLWCMPSPTWGTWEVCAELPRPGTGSEVSAGQAETQLGWISSPRTGTFLSLVAAMQGA